MSRVSSPPDLPPMNVMPPPPQQPMFISLEGIDGCGKSTQAKLLAEALSAQGYAVYLTKNPGGTGLGLALRHLLLEEGNPIEARTEILLYMADRTQHWFEKILPALRAGQIVICDRFIDSTLAYQGYGRGQSLDWLQALHQQALQTPERCFWPDLTLWLDAPVALCLERVSQRGQHTGQGQDRLEQEALSFYQQVQHGFSELAQLHPGRIKRVEATQPITALHQAILAQVAAVQALTA